MLPPAIVEAVVAALQLIRDMGCACRATGGAVGVLEHGCGATVVRALGAGLEGCVGGIGVRAPWATDCESLNN